LNALPNFVTEIDELDFHFIHVRSKRENALPVIITHGWPGSIIEQMKVIGPLTDPEAHGGAAADAFHVVIPSLPGYGFSAKPTKPGWNPVTIAKAWATLMQRLGYARFVAQGGDWGNAVSEVMALQAPPGLLGIHTNMAATVPADVSKALSLNSGPPAGLSAEEKGAWDQLDDFYRNGLGYANEMSLRPQTLYGIVDSPVGLAGWILDHDIRSLRMISRVFDGKIEGLSRDDVLDNITLTTCRLAVSSTCEASSCRSPLAPSLRRSIRHHAAGRSAPTRNSYTTTGSTAAATSPRGNSRRSSQKSCGRRSGRCGRHESASKSGRLVEGACALVCGRRDCARPAEQLAAVAGALRRPRGRLATFELARIDLNRE